MTPPADQPNDTTAVRMTTLPQNFEAITITGYYTRDIRFPVRHTPIESFSSDQWNGPLYKMRDRMP